MDLTFSDDLRALFNKNIYEVAEFLKSQGGIETLKKLGETQVLEKVLIYDWGSEDEKFVMGIMRDLGINNDPEVEFNKEVYRKDYGEFFAREGIYIEDTLVIKKLTNKFNLEVNCFNSDFVKIIDEGWMNKEEYVINFILEIPPSLENKVYEEKIVVSTNYKTYQYKIDIHCIENCTFSKTTAFKTLDEFFALQQENYQEALACFSSPRFQLWLEENRYIEEKKVYELCQNIKDKKKGLQNFLQLLDYEVLPQMKVTVENDQVIITNMGQGYLYGHLEMELGDRIIERDWSEEEGSITLSGHEIFYQKLKVFSNGGYAEYQGSTKISIPKETCRLNEEEVTWSLFKGVLRIPCEKKEQIKIVTDNNFITYEVLEKELLIKRNFSLLKSLVLKYRKTALKSNLRIITVGEVKHYKINVI